ncbi:MAG: 4-hydroxy-tetrahydrodipicolinate reductase [Candidatus Hydrogenedentes bacterium]|nr:4-hydroxy-tetrahydrodipicolinate reductase [Candidatus Hydrogenedentota bacterium]
MKICMAGALGRMGRRILEMAVAADDAAIGSAFDAPERGGTTLDVGAESVQPQTVTISANAAEAVALADVMIDFTYAGVCLDNVRAATAAGVPSVIGTTGLTDAQMDELRTMAEKLPIVYAPNMSRGVNLLFYLTTVAAEKLGLDYNCEVLEMHHNLKKDAPSGTAVRLAENAAGALGLDYGEHVTHGREGLIGERPKREIGIHSMRGGDVIGDHTVFFVGQGERIELSHRSSTRDHYANGALTAARFALNAKPGFYDMQDVLGLR